MRRVWKILCATALGILLGLAEVGLSHAVRPPMVRSQAVGQLFRLNPPIYGTLEADAKTFAFEISRTYANLWARDKRYLIDAEWIDDRARLALRPSSNLELGLGVANRRLASTQTDQMAISFHELLMMGQDGRLEAGKHQTRYKIPDYSLELTSADRNRALSEQLHADLSVSLLEGREVKWQLALTALLSYEMATHTPYFVGAIDRGWQLNGTYPWSDGAVYAAITQVFFDDSREVAVATQHQQSGWALGLGQTLEASHELVGQIMVFQPVFRQLGQLSRNSYEIHLAYRYHWEKLAFEATLIENIFWLYNSPDWGFLVGMRTAFP